MGGGPVRGLQAGGDIPRMEPMTVPKHRLASEALDRACERLGGASNPRSQLIAVVECLWWIDAANEFLRAHSPAYEGRRDLDAGGQTVCALIWARNRATHDPYAPVELARLTDGYADSSTSMYGVFVWKDRGSIRLGAPVTSSFGMHEYDKLLSGKPAIDTIRRASDYLRDESVR